MEQYLIDFLEKLLSIDSPAGYCEDAINYLEAEALALGFKTNQDNKGNLHIHIAGKSDKTMALCAHVDTLGLMVTSINDDGTLAFTEIGSPTLPTLDGEYCRIITRDKKIYTGTILCNSFAKHVHLDASTLERKAQNMHIRIDEIVKNKDDVLRLGIGNGDFIAIETKTTVTKSGFIKSRFLDNKLSVACLFGVLNELKKQNITPNHNIIIVLSTYEEVSHG